MLRWPRTTPRLHAVREESLAARRLCRRRRACQARVVDRCRNLTAVCHRASRAAVVRPVTATRTDMRYVMRQKLLSWGDDYTIKDEEGRDLYFVDGKAFSLGGQLSR